MQTTIELLMAPVLALGLACSQQPPQADGGTDASFDGIPTVCGVLITGKHLCVHCGPTPGTSEPCTSVCNSSDSGMGCTAGPADGGAACGDIVCGTGCTCFDPTASACQCAQ